MSALLKESQLEDHDLLREFKVSSNREQAFNLLVKKYQQRVYWHIRKMVIDHDDADDLTQEVFVKIWRKLDTFKGDSQLFTWIYRIATNECLNFLGRKKRRAMLSLQDVSTELSRKIDEDEHISGDEIQKKLQKALLQLPDKQRLVFNMKYFDEMPYKEISNVLGTSIGALKASYHLAVKKIEAYVNND